MISASTHFLIQVDVLMKLLKVYFQAIEVVLVTIDSVHLGRLLIEESDRELEQSWE